MTSYEFYLPMLSLGVCTGEYYRFMCAYVHACVCASVLACVYMYMRVFVSSCLATKVCIDMAENAAIPYFDLRVCPMHYTITLLAV